MGLFTFLTLMAILAFTLYISYFNTAIVALHLTETFSLQISIPLLILSSILLGIFLVLFADGYRRIAYYINQIREKWKIRGEKKAEELYNKSSSIYMGGAKKAAAKTLKKLLSHNPRHIRGLALLGKIKREEGEVAEAIKYHTKAKRIDPDNIEILYNLLEDYVADERLGGALRVSKKLTTLNPHNPTPLEKMRDIYTKKRDWNQAIDVQKQLISINKGTTNNQKDKKELLLLKYKKGIDLIEKREEKDGAATLREIISDNPGFVPAYITIANLHLAEEKIKDAIKTLETGYKETKEFIILKTLVDIHQLSGDNEATFEAYRWGISVNPEDPHLHLMLGELYIRKEMGEEGLAELAKAQERLSSHASLHLLMSAGHKVVGNMEESQKAAHLAFKAGVKELTRYKCSDCGNNTSEWGDKCPSCSSYGTLKSYPI